MGIWIELGIFLLVFVFAWWQFRDLRKERERREARARALSETAPSADSKSCSQER